MLTQLDDSASFHLTLSALQQIDPHTILFPSTLAHTPLIDFVRRSVLQQREDEEGEEGEAAVLLLQVERRWFNESAGRESIVRVCTEGSVKGVGLDSGHYLCVSAAAALLHWLQEERDERFQPHALRLSYRTITQLMKIDPQTAAALELITSKQPLAATAASASSASKPRPASATAAAKRRPPRTVFDCLNHTRTVSGARLLRSSLLQPFRDRASITARLDALEELMRLQGGGSSSLSSLPALLSDFNQFDSVLMQALVRPPPAQQTDHTRCQAVLHLIQLRRWMEGAQAVAAVLADCQSALLLAARAVLGEDSSAGIIAAVSAQIDESSYCVKGGDLISLRNTIAYAVRGGQDGYLQTSQHCYVDTLRDINAELRRVNSIIAKAASQQVQQAADDRPCGSADRAAGGGGKVSRKAEAKREAKLVFSQARGYHFHLSASVLQQQQALCRTSLVSSSDSSSCSLDSRTDCVHFIQPVTKGRAVAATTSLMLSLQQRQQEVYSEILCYTAPRISSLTAALREQLPFLLACSDELAVLDLLLSFATSISTASIPYSRPELSLSDSISLRGCCHPLLQALLPPGACVPNDVFLSQCANLCVLTGVNGGGKSSYLRMIGVALVMAGIGMFLPCEEASVRLCDELFLRGTSAEGGAEGGGGVGTRVGEESSSSALYREMKDVTHILLHCRCRCVVLLDEVGRSTSSLSGLSLAWAVAEQLSAHPHTYSVLATHFTQLSHLHALYPSILNIHTAVRLLPAASSSRLQYLYSVGDGAFDSGSHYGIDVAAMCGMDAAVIAEAHRVQAELLQRRGREEAERRVDRSGEKVRRYHEAMQELLGLRGASLPPAACRAALLRIRDQYCSRRAGGGEAVRQQRQPKETKQETKAEAVEAEDVTMEQAGMSSRDMELKYEDREGETLTPAAGQDGRVQVAPEGQTDTATAVVVELEAGDEDAETGDDLLSAIRSSLPMAAME